MSVLNENTIIGASAAGGDYEIEHSLRLHNRGGDGASTGKTLRRTPSVNSNRKTWTLSMWHKRGDINMVQMQDLFFGTGAGGGGDGVVRLRFERGAYATRDKLWISLDGPTPGLNAVTNRLFRDPSAWMHIVLRFDTTQATATNRVRVYINGEVIPSTDYSHLWTSAWTNVAQNSEWAVNKAGWYESFAGTGSTSNPDNVLGGYLADIAFVDGQSLGPDSFGETGDYGEWKPIDVSELTFGTNGYHLDFADGSAMGNDANGSNNFSVYNITANDQMLDSPTNNFATLNPLSSFTGYATAVLSEGNLQASLPDNAEGKGSISVSSGKWYFEGFAKTATNNKLAFGIHKADGIFTGGTSIPNHSSAGLVWFGHNGIQGYASDSSYGTFTAGDIIGVKLDMDSKTIQFTKNGTAQGTKDFSSANFDTVVASVFSGQTSNVGVLNFGSDSSFAGNKTPQNNQDSNGIGDFYHSVPSGFLSLCTSNLPSVDVIPSEHFKPVIYAGNGGTQSISVGFPTDFTWLKNRGYIHNHFVLDTVRGAPLRLVPNQTNAESNGGTGSITSFTSDGFVLGNGGGVNSSSYNYVSWNWKAGGSAVSNTNGTITSSVSANVDSGFSIVSYTGTGSAATVGHGLASTPTMIIVKNRSVTNPWWVYTETLGAGKQLRLNDTNAAGSDGGVIWNNTAPTSSVFSVNTNTGSNGSGNSLIAYCFHSVESYSKVGSYTGNTSSTDGTFVHCGFAVSFLLIKDTGAGNTWVLLDSKRDSINPNDTLLQPQSSAAETTGWAGQVDFLSNGFKIRSNDNALNAARTYIFYAIAENPFKHTNAR